MNEKELIQKAKGGDNRAMEALYECVFDSLFKYVRFKVDSVHQAEDICSEAFIKAFENLQKFKEKSTFKTYVYTIAKNLIYDQYGASQKTVVSSEISIEFENVVSSESAEQTENEVLDANEKRRDECSKELKKILANLDERAREVLELRYLSQMSVGEVGEVLKISESNVKVISHRALEKLRSINLTPQTLRQAGN